jgi:hypothetical protein
MSEKKGGHPPKASWLDDKTDAVLIHDYANRLSSFLDAIADGKIDDHELKGQEERLVAVMKKVEPKLSPELHAEVTDLLCELTAYNIMHTVHGIAKSLPKRKFIG